MSEPGRGKLNSWSFSTHNAAAKCPKRVYYQKIEKLPDPIGPAGQRGILLHDALEAYALDKGNFPASLSEWRPAIDHRLAEYDSTPELSLGANYALTKTTSFKKGPVRAKIDLLSFMDDGEIEIVDYKTGRQYDYHENQLELYATLALLEFVDVERVKVANWYLDRPGEVIEKEFSRAEEERLLTKWRAAIKADIQRRVWPAQRNQFCSWCPFNSRKGGPCVEGA